MQPRQGEPAIKAPAPIFALPNCRACPRPDYWPCELPGDCPREAADPEEACALEF